MQPIEQAIQMLRLRITMLLQIKDAKIPFYEKLPKDNQFYKHYVQNIKFARMKEAATQKADEDKVLFDTAAENIEAEHQKA